MTTLQQFTITKLLSGYNLSGNSYYGYRLRDPEGRVCRKISDKTFRSIKNLLRKKGPLFIINKSKVRQLHGNTLVKQEYKDLYKEKKKRKEMLVNAGWDAKHLSKL